MIIHLPEGMVPFEDSGVERHPRLPLVGQPVTLGCRLEGNEEIPYLILRLDGREERLEARPGAAGGLFRFELGAFDRAAGSNLHEACPQLGQPEGMEGAYSRKPGMGVSPLCAALVHDAYFHDGDCSVVPPGLRCEDEPGRYQRLVHGRGVAQCEVAGDSPAACLGAEK